MSNSSEFFKTLKLIFISLLAGQVMIFAFIWWLLSQNEVAVETGLFFGNGILLLVIFGWVVFAAFYLYKKRASRAEKLPGLLSKLSHYRISSVFRWAMLELGNLLLILVSYFEQNQKLLMFFAVGLLIFFMTRPTVEAFSRDYNLTEEESNML